MRKKAELLGSEEPAEKLRKEGDPAGHPQQVFDPEKRLWYHLDGLGERRYIGCPEGFEFDAGGRLVPLPEAE